MKIFKSIVLSLAYVALCVNPALALIPNSTYMIRLSTVSSLGQLEEVSTTSAKSNTAGKVSFTFSNVPDNATSRFLMVQILDGSGAVVRQAMSVAPSHGSHINMGISEVTDKQSKAMLQAIVAGGNDNPTSLMLLMTMVQSGAISDEEARNLGPLAINAAQAMETFMSSNGVTQTQMATFKSLMLRAMDDYSSRIREAVDAPTSAMAATKMGEAMSNLQSNLMDAAANINIPVDLLPAAFNEAGKVVGKAAPTAGVTGNVMAAVNSTLQVDAEQRQLATELRQYEDALSVMGAAATYRQQFRQAAAVMTQSLVQARAIYGQMFADPESCPNADTIGDAAATAIRAMQRARDAFASPGITASDEEVAAMLNGMTTHLHSENGAMSGMTAASLARMQIGKMKTTPDGALQNWTILMVAVNDFLESGLELAYTPSTTLADELAALGVTPPAMPAFGQFDESYQAFLELHYDLMLARLISAEKLAQRGDSPTDEQLAQLAAEDLAMMTALRDNIAGLTDIQKDALILALAPPRTTQS